MNVMRLSGASEFHTLYTGMQRNAKLGQNPTCSSRIGPVAMVAVRESVDACSSLDGGCFELPLPRFSLDLGVPTCM